MTQLRLLCCVLMCCVTASANAANMFLGKWYQEPYAFTLSLYREALILKESGSTVSIPVSGLRTELAESFFNGRFHLGMRADRYWLGGRDARLQEGSGFALGLSASLTSTPVYGGYLGTRLVYMYDRAEGDDDAYVLVRHDLRSEALAMRYFFDSIGLYLGFGAWGHDSRVSADSIPQSSWYGTINRFYKFGVDILVEPGGHVGIESTLGPYNGIEVYFQRRY